MGRISNPSILTALFSAWLVACSGDKPDDPSIIDADGDLVFADQDCDDENATVFPGAMEVCDGFDNNCDGQIDEGRTVTYYADLDGDGFGGDVETIEACSLPSGYGIDATDCDDNDPTTYPGADEYCDAVDHNCDGQLELNAVDQLEWYLDDDGDGFGNRLVTDLACTAPPLHVADNTDCNDGSLLVYPGQTEFCNNIDDNCDGIADEDTAVDASTWYADGDNDGFGDPNSAFVACQAPSGSVSSGGDCDDIDPLIHPDATEICDGGVDNDCDPATDEEVVAAPMWYTDSDDDEYGVEPALGLACTEPPNAALTDDDCDDGFFLI